MDKLKQFSISEYGADEWYFGKGTIQITDKSTNNYMVACVEQKEFVKRIQRGLNLLGATEMNLNMPWVKPQKAQDYDEAKKAHQGVFEDNNDWIAEEKLDGWRVYVTTNAVYSSTGKLLKVPWLLGIVPAGVMIDGELIGAASVISTDVSTLIASDPEALRLRVFDLIYLNGEFIGHRQLIERLRILDTILEEIMDVRVAASERHHTNKERLLEDVYSRGGEGIMLKNLYSIWKPSSRVGWIKVKQVYTVDVVIVDAEAPCTEWTVRPGKRGTDGVLYPEGKRSSSYEKGFVCCHYGFYDTKGELRIAGSLGESGTKEDMQKWVGRVVELKGYGSEPLSTGALRHPQFIRFRDDKLAEDCVFEFND